ncbi:MAG: GNAT family N-acetyltransferase [Dorea sp.]|jgi:GNAT superfamily N-acetyltransferase|nr:GNAT family N-acetyltransferase [Dorea sp.]GFI42625.1 acetyltransferase [Lachnospiraceae bacterium]
MYQLHPCSEEDKKSIIDGLVAYNLACVPAVQEEMFIDLSIKAVSESGKVIGGIIARMYCWDCADVDALWVSEQYRRTGLGKKLLLQVEAKARKKGARLIHLDTFDFQARGFYESQGYEVFGVLEDCPAEHKRYYLKKLL